MENTAALTSTGTEEGKLRKFIPKPSFNRCVMFNDDLAAIHMKKTKVRLDRPTYV